MAGESSTPLKCLEVVAQYRTGRVTRDFATNSIINILKADDQVPKDESGTPTTAATGAYWVYLNEIDRDHARRASTMHTSTGREEEDDEGVNGEGGDREVVGEDVEDEEEQAGIFGREDGEHNRIFGPLAVGTGGRDPGAAARPTRKQIARSYPWVIHPPPTSHVDPILAETLRLKNIYLLDLKFAKTSILSQLGCPNFPDSLWTELLANRYIDFGKLLGHIHAINPSSRVIERIGDIEISTRGTLEPITAIKTQGQWSSAFGVYRKAVIFVYPHRGEELDTYHDAIINYFNVTIETEHYRIINLDKSIRLRVAGSNSISLNAPHHDLAISHINTIGIGSSSSAAISAVKTTKINPKTPICRNWNFSSCSGCSYRHCCLRCLSLEHSISQCDAAKSSADGNQQKDQQSGALVSMRKFLPSSK